MPVATQPGETDLLIPLPGAEQVDPYTVHTHYFGFTVPEARIGAFIYARYQPAFPLSQGGVGIFRGLDNLALLDAEHHDYRATMPWPQTGDGAIRFVNGLVIEALEPGELLRVSYRSPDGATWFEVEQRAITPLLARGYIVPGEEDHHAAGDAQPGGIEQFLQATGELVLRGERFEVDCLAVRDRSWNQVRVELPGGARPHPPIGWTPIAFGPELALNTAGFEAPDSDPAWRGLFDVPDDAPTHYESWISRDGEVQRITEVRREVLEYHPYLHAAVRQTLEVVDESGERLRFDGEAIAMAPMHSWPNIAFCDSVYRWTAEDGRQTHCTYQEIWHDTYQRAMKARRSR
ncbi:MAG TPA: tyrosine protein kinase [Baekduia sp.]|nr:tyrosine protein kinase [Baekduia sp.]